MSAALNMVAPPEPAPFITQDGKHLAVPFRADLASLLPHAKPLDYQGSRWLVFPNGREEARLCRNLGVPIPAPILTTYGWAKQTPWEIQKITAALLTESPRCYVLSTMGTGKTLAALFAADYLLETGQAHRVLIAAPLSTLTPVWESEVFRRMPHRKAVVLHGPRAKRLRLLEQRADFFIINHHGLHMLQRELVNRGFDIIILDELAVFRNKSTDLWKAATTVVEKTRARWVWGMTGSPTPSAPTDAWAQIKLLTPNNVPRTMGQFKDLTMRQVTQFKHVARPEANDLVYAAMQPSVRYTRDDVMELPETSYVDREVKLDADAAKAYKMLFNQMRLKTDKGHSITAVNEGVLQSKLLQVACGYLYTDDNRIYEMPSTNRQAALEEVIAETDRKVIVFVPFVHALTGISNFLRSKGHSVATVHGSTSRTIRDKIFTNFQTLPDPRIIVAHPQCMSHGLTLTEANTIIWYSPTQSLEVYEQACARITRPGQTSKTLIAHLYGTGVEKAVYARLKARGKMQGLLLNMFKEQELEF